MLIAPSRQSHARFDQAYQASGSSTLVLEARSPSGGATATQWVRVTGAAYIYNLAAQSLDDSSASYRLAITVPATGQTTTVDFGLKPPRSSPNLGQQRGPKAKAP